MASNSTTPDLTARDIRAALDEIPRLAAILRDRVPGPHPKALNAWAGAARALTEWADGVEAQWRIVQAAQAQWRYFACALDAVTFQNAAGELAHVPFALVRLLAEGATLPFVMEVVGPDVVYRRGTAVFCRVPCTLHVVLKDLIAGRPWETPGK